MYTSNSEFDLETRVQITNEVPAVRTYQQMHHSLQNDTWKWLIGTEDVDYDLPVGGKYIEGVDADGNPETRELIAPPVKIVNGKQAASYGPSISKKWNPDTESYEEYIPKFHRTEINGTLAAEHDLFLHEIYRYLNCIYPDHPDWLNLLTRNEVIDAFNNAAAMVDYKPNNEFFKLVADSIGDVDGSEEFKLNLRNLTSNAARRKFFGSTLGYRMTGHDAYEDIMVFPIGKNLTIAPMTGTKETDSNGEVLYKPSNNPVKNYIIDTFDERYQTLFRRIDFNGDSRDTSFVSSNSVMLPAYTLPGYEDFIFEFVSSKDGSSTLQDYTIYKKNKDYSFFKNYNENSIGSIVGQKQYNVLEPKLESKDESTYVSYVSSDDKILGFQLTSLAKTSYLKLFKYKSLDELEQFQIENGLDANIKSWGTDISKYTSTFFSKYLSPLYSFCTSSESNSDYSSIRSLVDYTYNPFIKNTIMLPPSEMIKLYGKTKFDDNDNVINVASPSLVDVGTSIKTGDFISFKDSLNNDDVNVYEVCGASWGVIDAGIVSNGGFEDYESIKSYSPFNELNDAIYSNDDSAIVVQNRDGDYIVLHGSLRCYWKQLIQNSSAAACLDKIKFVIKSIPETKSNQIFKLLYGNEYLEVIDEIKSELKESNEELNRASLLIQNVEATLSDEPLTIYEDLSARDNLTSEEKEELANAINKLEQYAYSYWLDYKNSKEKIERYTKDLESAQNEISRLKNNKSLVVKDDILSIGCDCKILFIGSFNNNKEYTYTRYKFLLDDDYGYIENISLGNVSVLPIDPTATNTVPINRFYKGSDNSEIHYQLAKIDLKNLYIESSQAKQLYSNILEEDKEVAFTSNIKFELYNEKTFTVTAQVFVDKKENQLTNEMQFLTEDAKNKFDSICIGSKVYGPGIGDAYVTSISNNSLTISTSIPKSGYLTYSFECPITTSPVEVKDDPFNYKRVMNDLGIYDKVSFFDHGVYGTKEWPDVSAVVFDGDLRDKQILNPKTFRQVVKYLYGDKLSDNPAEYLVPSIAKYTRDVFVDIKADKLIDLKNHKGHTGNLMNVDWLDYIQNNSELALAKENVNVGANIILNTDLSGYASLIKDSQYTDEKLKILFQTNNWDENTIPAYVQIGTGGSNYSSFFKLTTDVFYPNVYGATFWDQTAELAKDDNGKVDYWVNDSNIKLKKRSTYSKVETLADASSLYSTYENIDSPLFEIPLNEYNIQLKTFQNEKSYTIIDALFYEQGFKNITRSNPLRISKANSLYTNLISSYPSVNSRGDSLAEGIHYYYLADGSKPDEEKGSFYFVNLPKKDDKPFTKYEVLNGGVFGSQLYYFNSRFYVVLGNEFYATDNDNYKSLCKSKSKLLNSGKTSDEILKALLMLKAYYNMGNIRQGADLKIKLLDEGEIDYVINNITDSFENKLILFSYIKGAWDYNEKSSGPIDESDIKNGYDDPADLSSFSNENVSGFKDFFNHSTYDTLGLLWVDDGSGGKVELININKNYTICTADNIQPLKNLTKVEENLFYGYYSRTLFSNYSKIRIEGITETRPDWNPDISAAQLELDNSFINYSSKIFNTIKLPRKYIANGSYDINLFIDPQFIGSGWEYDKYIKGERDEEVKFNISQSAIRYDKDNDLFYTNAAEYNKEDNTFETTNKKFVIKFEEQKYFKNLKFLFGSYQTKNTQFEGLTDITKEAYIKGITLQPFDVSDLSTSDKFISIQEVDLRSVYTPLLNSRVFDSTKRLVGEIYGVTEAGDYYVSGKRTQLSSRLYDDELISALNDIVPCSVADDGTLNIIKNYAAGVTFDSSSPYASPSYESVSIKKSIDPRYTSNETETPDFKYYKNLLVFEGLINLKKPNAIEAPVDDTSIFNLVTQTLNSGDTIEGAVCLSGGGYATHTITTNIEEKAKFVAVNGSDVQVITSSGVWKNVDPINFDAVNNATFSPVKGIPELEGTVTNVIWDEDLNSFVATLGRNPSIINEEFGLMRYESSVAVQLTSVPTGEKPTEVYASSFESNLMDSFVKRDDGIYIYNAATVAVSKITDQDNIIETETVNPNDVAFRIYRKNNNDEGTTGNENEIYGLGNFEDGTHLVMKEGPYVPKEPEAGEQIHRSVFSVDGIDIALIQDYIFIKSKNYLVDNNGNYTRQMSTNRHWKATKLPETLDNTELFLKSHTLTGSDSVYEYVKNVYDTFASWAFKDNVIVESETKGEVTLAGLSLDKAYKKEDVEYFRDTVKNYMENNFLDYEAFKANCKYYNESGEIANADASNYTSLNTAITKVECDTDLPLDENFRIDTGKSYKISGTTADFVIQSKKSQNYINFDEMYYQYATIVMKYLIGEVVSENFGTSCITNVDSSSSKVFFKTFNDDFFSIDKNKLYKFSDFSKISNWKTALMPAGTYVRGSYANSINDFHTVTIKSPTTSDDVVIPVSAKTVPIKFFHIKTDMYITSDGKHIFFGGCTVPMPKIKAAIKAAGNPTYTIETELMDANYATWLNGPYNKGTAPMILYSDDSGESFKILPIKEYVDSSLFSDNNFEVASFKEQDGKLLAFVKRSEGGYESNQIVISFNSATGDVDTESTVYKAMSIADNGNVHSTPAGDGTLTWSDGALGFGIDIDASEMNGSNTLNFDWTGANSLTIPSGLVIKNVSDSLITLNKGFASDDNSNGKLRVLFSVSTKSDIPIQAQFISSDVTKQEEYKNISGLFKVPTIKQVYNDTLANRIYSSRYLLDNEVPNVGVGYPTVDEDTTHIYYEYEDNVVVPLKNAFGNEVKLCSADGYEYIFNDRSQTLEDMVNYDIDVSFAKTAGKNTVDIKSALTNVPSMLVDNALSSNYKFNLKSFDIKNNYALVKADKNPLNYADFIEADDLDSPEVEDVVKFILRTEGDWGSSDNNFSKEERFSIRELVRDGKTTINCLYDNKYGCYVLKSRHFIEGLLVIPYTFYNKGNGISVIADPVIEYKDDDDNYATMIGDGAHSSGIFYHPMGYGGLRNNTSITDCTPWDRDPIAFDNKLLKNNLGDYVYLTDKVGNLIDVYNSIKIAGDNESVTYNDFLNDGYNYIRFGKTLKECYSEGHDAKFFKLNETDFRIVPSLTKIKSGSKFNIRVFNNAQACWFETPYDGKLYDENEQPVGDISVKVNGVATVGKLNTASKVHFEMPVSFSYEKVEGEDPVTGTEDVTFEFDVEGNTINAYAEIISEKPIIFHKSENGYMAITDVGVNGNITAQYQFRAFDGANEIKDTTLLDCSVTSGHLTYNEDHFVLDLTLGMSEFKDVSIIYNGLEIYRLPIFAIDDEIFLLEKDDGTFDYYIGDAKLGPEFDTFRKNIGNKYTKIDKRSLPLTYGMERSIDVEQGDIIIGLRGKSISKAPKYKNLSDLIYYEGVFIYKDVLYTQDNCNCIKNIKIESVASDNSSFKLQNPLGGKLAKYNDDKEHYFLFRILTISRQSVKPENMNNQDYYYNLDLEEMTTFPPDRVWFNPNGSPQPPIKVGNKIFNSENNYAYYDEDYINANDCKIHLCDEEGHYVNYDADGNEYRLDNGDGDCSNYVYAGFDGRYISPKPVNATCQEWYKNNIWSKNKEVNPLWQIINIKSYIKNKKWEQKVVLNRYEKLGDNQIITDNIEHPYVQIKDITKIYVKDDIMYFINQAENFSIENGELQLLLSEGSDYYNTNDDLTLYGLHFSPAKYIENVDKLNTLASTLQASYTVNTLKDFAINVQDNNTIAEITELGIFDKNHKLIAYANFPPVEYRTDTQHVAFTCIIYNGRMVKNKEESEE